MAPFELCRLAAPELIKNKGNIIFTSAIASFRGASHMMAYATAKAALDNMARCITGDLAPKGVRVNLVKYVKFVTLLLDSDPLAIGGLNDSRTHFRNPALVP